MPMMLQDLVHPYIKSTTANFVIQAQYTIAIVHVDSDGSDSADEKIFQKVLQLSKETAAMEASSRTATSIARVHDSAIQYESL